jgi:hypothetical protein
MTKIKSIGRLPATILFRVPPSGGPCSTTACPAPGAFDSPSPANGATNQPLTVTLSWQASSGADRYQVFLGLSPNAMSLAATVSTSRTAISGLAFNTTYYWKVTAKNSCGDKAGPVWSFMTQLSVLNP